MFGSAFDIGKNLPQQRLHIAWLQIGRHNSCLDMTAVRHCQFKSIFGKQLRHINRCRSFCRRQFHNNRHQQFFTGCAALSLPDQPVVIPPFMQSVRIDEMQSVRAFNQDILAAYLTNDLVRSSAQY